MLFERARVLSFESRRAEEIAELIRINQGEPLNAPALREVPIEENQQALAFADRLYAGAFEMIIFLTGVGTRYLAKVIGLRDGEERFVEALKTKTIVARGPKPMAVLREWNVPVAVAVPEPNTWRELLEAVKDRRERTVAVQEYGRGNEELVCGLEAQGRTVTCVPVYRWELPADTRPLGEALQALIKRDVDVTLFTTGVQVEHFLRYAEEQGERETAKEALERTFLASIGPTCSEVLQENGLTPAFEPSHPKMGLLVREAALRFAESRAGERV